MSRKNGTSRKKRRLVGYARVSKGEQNLDLQRDALREVGCDVNLIFVDKVSGAKADRPGLEACLAELTQGDVLTVWRLDRLGRSMPHLISTIEDLKERGVGFRSISDGVVDTTSPTAIPPAWGHIFFQISPAGTRFMIASNG